MLMIGQEMAKAHKIPDYGWTMQNVNQWPSNNSKDHLEMIQRMGILNSLGTSIGADRNDDSDFGTFFPNHHATLVTIAGGK
ncbi:Cellulose synthase [Arabidopsis thaliana x Arabidopsis arenosa]|uniref:Cellulose synthase n=1 Tax=Arabidopsis thaliana x Arabidopsis arenosa TaxID=1240361 RepID=A0A8T2BQ42_9BRAS|nr:Cellulose synthase [Arabidopsis thaliana x Arabidopsis arenosa]